MLKKKVVRDVRCAWLSASYRSSAPEAGKSVDPQGLSQQITGWIVLIIWCFCRRDFAAKAFHDLLSRAGWWSFHIVSSLTEVVCLVEGVQLRNLISRTEMKNYCPTKMWRGKILKSFLKFFLGFISKYVSCYVIKCYGVEGTEGKQEESFGHIGMHAC